MFEKWSREEKKPRIQQQNFLTHSCASDILLGLEQHSTQSNIPKQNQPNQPTKQTPKMWNNNNNNNEFFGNPLDKFEMILIIDWIVVNQFSMPHSKGSNFYVWDDESTGSIYGLKE